MLTWVLVITFFAVLLTARDWRKGLLAVLLIGVLQDVFRKLTPGVPSYYILWSTVVYAFVAFAAFRSRGMPDISQLYLRDRTLRLAILFFLLLIALQMVNSLVRYGNPAVSVLGGLFYLGPLAAMLVGASFVDSEARIRQFLVVYLVIFIPTCLTVYLSPVFASYFPVLRDVGTFIGRELVIYDVGTILESNPGVLRVGELAAWHAATCIIFLSILSLKSQSQAVRFFNAFLMLLLLGVIILTGRRKMLAALSIFFALQWSMLIWYRLGLRKISVVLLVLAVVISGATLTYTPSAETANYIYRGQTVYESLGERALLTFRLMSSAVTRSEGIGLGAGVTSQGARYAGGGASGAAGAAEAGLGKLIVELGLFGFLLIVAVFTIAAMKVRRQIPAVRDLGSGMLIYDISFIAFMVANLAAFAVASQLFGDLFILMVIGTVAGFVVRIHNVAIDHRLRMTASAVEVPAQHPKSYPATPN